MCLAYVGQVTVGNQASNTVTPALSYRVTPSTISATSSPGTVFVQTGATDLQASTHYNVGCDFNYNTSLTSTTFTIVGTISVTPGSGGWMLPGYDQNTNGGAVIPFNASVITPGTTNGNFTMGSDTTGDAQKHWMRFYGTIPTGTAASQFTISAFVGSNSILINAGACTFVQTQN